MADNDSQRHSSSVGSPSTVVTTPEADVHSDDVWASDDDQHDLLHANNARESLLSDLPTVRRQHMTDGYREGLAVGKAKVMQKGFDAGYPIGVTTALRVGKILGCLEGILASKDISDEVKVPVKKMLAQVKQELAVEMILKDTNDEEVMQLNGTPERMQVVLVKWEKQLFGSTD